MTANDAACYGVQPLVVAIAIVKLVDGQDANTPTAGPVLTPGAPVTWTYAVTNPGTEPLSNVTVRDDNGTANTADDFSPTFMGGDMNANGLLDPGETWTYTATGTVGTAGLCNVGTASGTNGSIATATDPACYRVPVVTPRVEIAIVKLVNGVDANSPAAAPVLTPGAPLTFTYVVTNPGNVPLSNVVVVDNNGTQGDGADDFSPTFAGGDTNANGLLDPGETWTYSASGTVGLVQYCNVGTVSGTNGTTVSASDPACYRVPQVVDIAIVKLVNGQDANTPAGGPVLTPGSAVTWTYVVTNRGTVPLSSVTVSDDNGTPGNTADDFSPVFVGGDTNNNGLLDIGETWTYTATGTVGTTDYCNVGTASGTNGSTASASDAGCYRVPPPPPMIAIVKLVNGEDANPPATGPVLTPGSAVTWTYVVTNPGTVPLSSVTVSDDNGTPGITADDFSPVFVGGDTNNNGLLDIDETWMYTATGTVGTTDYCNVGTAAGRTARPRPPRIRRVIGCRRWWWRSRS